MVIQTKKASGLADHTVVVGDSDRGDRCGGALIVTSLKSSGPVLNIQFSDGHGLHARGTCWKYRGIEIGEVTDVVADDRTMIVSLSKVRIGTESRDDRSLTRKPVLDRAAAPERFSREWTRDCRWAEISGSNTGTGRGTAGHRIRRARITADTESIGGRGDLNPFSRRTRFADWRPAKASRNCHRRGWTGSRSLDSGSWIPSVVRVRLVGQARRLGLWSGSQFWIERPRVSIAEVRGLETIVGGRYVALLPGPADAKPQLDFDGLDAVTHPEVPAGALEIVLNAPQRWGVDRGVAVTYRGLRVGQVLSVALASDGTSIEARAYIDARYRSLVRQNSVFWSNSGVDVNFGLTGFQFSAETLSSIAQGGVAFATPPEPAHSVSTGQRFPLLQNHRVMNG